MAEQYTNIRYILDRIMQHPLMQDTSLEQVVDLTISFMRLVGVPDMFIDKVELIEVSNYRAMLPCDYYKTNQIRLKGGNTFRYTTDTFHLSECEGICNYDLTYKIQGGIIYTSIKEGIIELSYQAINIDSEGYPLLPDNSSFTRALELFIKQYLFTILFDLGKISVQVLQNTQRDYAWAVRECESEFNRLSLDKAESFYNSWRTLILRDTEHSRGFINNGVKERIKIH